MLYQKNVTPFSAKSNNTKNIINFVAKCSKDHQEKVTLMKAKTNSDYDKKKKPNTVRKQKIRQHTVYRNQLKREENFFYETKKTKKKTNQNDIFIIRNRTKYSTICIK